MAIFEKTIQNKKFDQLLRKLENEIPDSSWSAELEAGSDFKEGDARCSVRVFERYSVMGGNRLSLTLTMFQNGDNTMMHTFTTYYVTFQVESGDRMELTVDGSEYGMLVEGDIGKLSFQGTRYLGFQRN